MLQGPLLKVFQLPIVLNMDIKFEPFAPTRLEMPGLLGIKYPRRYRRHHAGTVITHGDARYLPNYL